MEVERVTLGVVGDAGVGKTTLVVSFTANYVCQEYRPTALDAFSTIVRLNDALVVDLRIWDNAGSKEYCGLRPLTYPQTEVFLVCFSLKSRKSFENVTRIHAALEERKSPTLARDRTFTI
ncbi:RAC2-like protein [Mya arenaria]|uniref:RAC2-like protein n=1 Tax=Mya arenaria TaxID=6604 RepID=A0ABY7E444_MYAAR|nr:RAC2-like protein [Mya arenaria]